MRKIATCLVALAQQGKRTTSVEVATPIWFMRTISNPSEALISIRRLSRYSNRFVEIAQNQPITAP